MNQPVDRKQRSKPKRLSPEMQFIQSAQRRFVWELAEDYRATEDALQRARRGAVPHVSDLMDRAIRGDGRARLNTLEAIFAAFLQSCVLVVHAGETTIECPDGTTRRLDWQLGEWPV